MERWIRGSTTRGIIIGGEHLCLFYITRSSGWINKLTGCRVPRWEFHPYKTRWREKTTASNSRALTARDPILAPPQFIHNRLFQRITLRSTTNLWVLPTGRRGNHAGALSTGCEGEKIMGVVYRSDSALTPVHPFPPFLPSSFAMDVLLPPSPSFFRIHRRKERKRTILRDDPRWRSNDRPR